LCFSEGLLVTLLHRFYTAMTCLGFAMITACNPVPLSVVASDFSINGVTGTVTVTAGAQVVRIDLTSKDTRSQTDIS
jgi:hypothetical protein